jgi:hypothetical protein
MRKYVIVCSYWVGTVCAALGLLARSLDILGMNFLDFNTRGGGIGYHSLMDGTLFFYAISVGNASYQWFISQEPGDSAAQDNQRTPGSHAIQDDLSRTES